jgi:hypothetical protein
MFPLPFNLLLVWDLLSGQSSYCMKYYTIFLQNVEIFRNIFFQRIVFGSRKRKNISKFFWEDFYLSKLMNQLIEMCGSCPWIACITIYCWFKVWTCHKLGGRPIVQWATAFLMDISRLAAEIVHTTSSEFQKGKEGSKVLLQLCVERQLLWLKIGTHKCPTDMHY